MCNLLMCCLGNKIKYLQSVSLLSLLYICQRQAQKLSGMKPKAYISTCQTVERLLNVTSQVSLRDLAVKFDCLEAEDLAQEVEGRWVLCEVGSWRIDGYLTQTIHPLLSINQLQGAC